MVSSIVILSLDINSTAIVFFMFYFELGTIGKLRNGTIKNKTKLPLGIISGFVRIEVNFNLGKNEIEESVH